MLGNLQVDEKKDSKDEFKLTPKNINVRKTNDEKSATNMVNKTISKNNNVRKTPNVSTSKAKKAKVNMMKKFVAKVGDNEIMKETKKSQKSMKRIFNAEAGKNLSLENKSTKDTLIKTNRFSKKSQFDGIDQLRVDKTCQHYQLPNIFYFQVQCIFNKRLIHSRFQGPYLSCSAGILN